ncbi:MAG: ABC transporter ATP-binding protein, partial [Gemmatimonadota bacterium]|nr:ABC transporter ATP-binding protein [Gemmatimonadota bacterium]
VLGGLVGPMTVGENLILGREAQGRFRSGLSLHPGRIKEYAESRIRTFDIRPADPGVKAESLSGGNQQKVVFAREAEGEPRILVAAHPTRGVDVGAMEAIHREILALRDAGVGILLVSADLSEVLMLSDRIVVLYTGLIAKEFRRGEADEESLGVVMTGGTLDDQVA